MCFAGVKQPRLTVVKNTVLVQGPACAAGLRSYRYDSNKIMLA